MSFRTNLLGAGMALVVVAFAAAPASAVPLTGSSSGTFAFSNCDGGNCATASGGTVLQWGSTSSTTDLVNPSTLTANTTNFGPITSNQNDVTLFKLTWFNNDSNTSSNRLDPNFDATLTLNFTFGSPVGIASDTFTLNFVITTSGGDEDDEDTIQGFSNELSNLDDALDAFLNPFGISVQDLAFFQPSGDGSSYDSGDGKWKNNENNTASLYIVGDIRGAAANPPAQDVPEPMTLGLLGAGLIGLGAAARRRHQS